MNDGEGWLKQKCTHHSRVPSRLWRRLRPTSARIRPSAAQRRLPVVRASSWWCGLISEKNRSFWFNSSALKICVRCHIFWRFKCTVTIKRWLIKLTCIATGRHVRALASLVDLPLRMSAQSVRRTESQHPVAKHSLCPPSALPPPFVTLRQALAF